MEIVARGARDEKKIGIEEGNCKFGRAPKAPPAPPTMVGRRRAKNSNLGSRNAIFDKEIRLGLAPISARDGQKNTEHELPLDILTWH